MVNEACEGQRQERRWYTLPAMRMCKPSDIHQQRREGQTEPSKNMFALSRVSLGIAGAEQLLSGSTNDHRKSGTCCSRLALRHSMGPIKWSLSVNLHCKCEAFFRFNCVLFFSQLLPSRIPVCRSQHASACRFNTSLCVEVLGMVPCVLGVGWSFRGGKR